MVPMDTIHRQMLGFSGISSVTKVRVRIQFSVMIMDWIRFVLVVSHTKTRRDDVQQGTVRVYLKHTRMLGKTPVQHYWLYRLSRHLPTLINARTY